MTPPSRVMARYTIHLRDIDDYEDAPDWDTIEAKNKDEVILGLLFCLYRKGIEVGEGSDY